MNEINEITVITSVVAYYNTFNKILLPCQTQFVSIIRKLKIIYSYSQIKFYKLQTTQELHLQKPFTVTVYLMLKSYKVFLHLKCTLIFQFTY
jgi:hypothetical protein